MVLKLKTAPTAEPLTRDEIKKHCYIDTLEDDIYLDNLALMAREYVELFCGPLINQTWEQYEQDWPCIDSLKLGKPRVQSTGTSLTYTDINSVTTTLATTNYSVDYLNEWNPAIVLNYGYSWPIVTLHPVNPIKITFTCGYGTSADLVPMTLKHIMLLLIGHWYQNREPVNVSISGNSVVDIPFTVDALLTNYRTWKF